MRWEKLGHVFSPSGEAQWMCTHAAVPIAGHLDGDVFRVWFSARDRANRSHTGSLRLELLPRPRVLDVASGPVLSPGELGAFDDSGAMASWVVDSGGRRMMYYIGWNLGVTVPFRNAIGLAVESGEGTFRRVANGPILDRSMDEPHFCASCCVIPGPDFWRMWYLSCTGWSAEGGVPRHRYHIKYAESDDGVHWRRDGRVAIDYRDDTETAISRPSVVRDGERWRMWYSFRGAAYRIGYAESDDGLHWTRLDAEAGIDVGLGGWDSEMIEYPFVFDHRGIRYMLYNGNGFGRTGFGIAALDE
jgi:hypothetical protein